MRYGDAKLTRTLLADKDVILQGAVMMLNELREDLWASGITIVTIPKGFARNREGVGNEMTKVKFVVGDYTAPTLAEAEPAHLSVPGKVDDIVLIFSESVQVAHGPQLQVRDVFGRQSPQSLHCTDTRVAVQAHNMTVSMKDFLKPCSFYEVTMEPGCVYDVTAQKNENEPIYPWAYTFETSCVEYMEPHENAVAVTPYLNLTGILIRFSEAVQLNGSVTFTPVAIGASGEHVVDLTLDPRVELRNGGRDLRLQLQPLCPAGVSFPSAHCFNVRWNIAFAPGALVRQTLQSYTDGFGVVQTFASVAVPSISFTTEDLDNDPPSVQLVMLTPRENQVEVSIRLNESGTAYCNAFSPGTEVAESGRRPSGAAS